MSTGCDGAPSHTHTCTTPPNNHHHHHANHHANASNQQKTNNNAPDEARLLRGVAAADLARQLQHQQRKAVPVPGDVLQVLRQKRDGQALRLLAQRQKGVPPRAGVRLGLGV